MIGPMQLVAIAFDDPDVAGTVLEGIEGLSSAGVVKVVDLLVVGKDERGDSVSIETSELELEEKIEYGAVIGGLLGLGMAGEQGAEAGAQGGALAVIEGQGLREGAMQALVDEVPAGGAGFFALLEHTWLGDIRDSILEAGGRPLASQFITPQGLVEAGAIMSVG